MFGHKIRCELERLNLLPMLLLGGVFLLIDFAVWCASSSPLYVLHLASDKMAVLPTWLFGLLDLLSFTLYGLALGAVLGSKCGCEVERYRGAFYFIIAVTLAYLHHIILFSYLSFFVAMLISAIVVFFIFVATANFFRVSKAGAILAVLGGLWSVYIFLFSILLFFLI